MTNRKRQVKRLAVAKGNGYVSFPVPGSPEWALSKLTEKVDEKATKAAMKLRGLSL